MGPDAKTDRRRAAQSVALIAAAGVGVCAWIAVVLLFNPRVAFNDGYGYLDGQTYSAAVRVLRGELDVPLSSPYVYRVLPLALVANAPVSLVSGFLALNLACLALCVPVLMALQRRFDVALGIALVSIAWWAVLPAGIRYATYYPTLLDGAGALAVTTTFTAAVLPSAMTLALVLPGAVLTRETTIAMPLLLGIAELRRGPYRALAVTVAASVLGVVAFSAVRLWPPLVPASGMTLLGDAIQNLEWLIGNVAERGWRYVAAPFLTLGVFTIIPLMALRTTRDVLAKTPAVGLHIVITLVFAAIGGGDYDRFAFWLTPALMVVSGAVLTMARLPIAALIALAATHVLLCIVVGTPGDGSEVAYRESVVALMPVSRIVQLSVVYLVAATAWIAYSRVVHGRRALPGER